MLSISHSHNTVCAVHSFMKTIFKHRLETENRHKKYPTTEIAQDLKVMSLTIKETILLHVLVNRHEHYHCRYLPIFGLEIKSQNRDNTNA